ncbi:MAG: hypothetical protein ACKVY0_13655 [Prosthecobacter sp.]|uniref:hypothetical protein n=1 Tax=Prosthecobacter sp. TaxID=1965333 RepID=UPI0039025AD4
MNGSTNHETRPLFPALIHRNSKRPWCIIANKIDLPEAAENLVHFKERFKRIKVHPVSAETGEGLDKLRKWLDEKIGQKYEK